MDKTRMTQLRKRDVARGLTVGAIRDAGTGAAVGVALGKAPGTVDHYRTDRPYPALLQVVERLVFSSDTDALPVIEAAEDAWEFHAICEQPTEELKAEYKRLMVLEADYDGSEDAPDAVHPLVHADRMERYVRNSRKLVRTIRELARRPDVDLVALRLEVTS